MPRKTKEQLKEPILPEPVLTKEENAIPEAKIEALPAVPSAPIEGTVVDSVPSTSITDLALNAEEEVRESERQIEAMMEKQIANKDRKWIIEMIEREATPANLRAETTTDFIKRHGITETAYYYYARKPQYRKKMVNLAIEKVKEHTAEVLENLAIRAKSDNKASELFLDYVLELSKNIDVRTAPVVAALTKEQKENLNKLLLDDPNE